MSNNPKNISLQSTGDPFVDLGCLVLESLQERFPDKNLLEILEFVVDVYIDLWNRNLYSVFHTNSKITNPITPGKHRSNTLNYYKSIIDLSEQEEHIQGFCKTCGKEGILYQNSREFFPVTGSKAFVNYHHGHESGIYLCRECSTKLFFVPLGVILIGGMPAMLHPHSEILKSYWKNSVINENLNRIPKGTSEGILKSKFRNPKFAPENALFDFAGELIREIHNENQTEFLQLIRFTNFGPAPDCAMFVLPNPVFLFLNKVLCHFRADWLSFVRRNYHISKSHWDPEKQQWFREEKKKKIELTEDDYLDSPNTIYQRLLNNRSILNNLFKTYKNNFLLNLQKFPLAIALYYVKEVLGMEKEQIKLITRIADVIFELSQKENAFKKYLFMLESPSKAFELRDSLLKIAKIHLNSGAKEPLVRRDEYLNYLFPDGQYWGEVRDLLLICIYEKMHDNQVNVSEIPETTTKKTETNTI